MINTQIITDPEVIYKILTEDERLLRAISPSLTPDPRQYSQQGCHVLFTDGIGTEYGFACLQEFTDQALIMHMNLKSQYWGKGKANECQTALEEFARTTCKIFQLIAFVPAESAKIVTQTAVKNYGFKQVGLIPNGTLYHDKLQDIDIISKVL